MITHCANRLPPAPARHGAVAVFTLVMMVVLIGFAALTVDVGAMYNTRADLQNAADAAALAGAGMYLSAEMSKVRSATTSPDFGPVYSLIKSQVTSIAGKYHVFGAKSTLVQTSDITTGYLDLVSSKSTVDTGAPTKTFNAVSVMLRREKGSLNGALPLTFAGIFGKTSANVSASAVAVLDDHVTGYKPGAPGSAVLWPFTIHKDELTYWQGQGQDAYSYDPDDNSVSKGSDSLGESKLYPTKYKPANFGLLNIGPTNSGSTDITGQIDNGISSSDLQTSLGSDSADFTDSSGKAITHTVSGNSGIKATMQSHIAAHVGDIVGIWVHDQSSGSGATVNYRTTGIQFFRVLDVNLSTGTKYFWVEPITYTGPGVITNPNAPSTNGAAGVVRLAR